MKHFYFDVFLRFTSPARILVTAAVGLFFPCGNNPESRADSWAPVKRDQNDIISQRKLNDFNKIISSYLGALAHVLTTVVGRHKGLNDSMFVEGFSETNALNSQNRHLLNHNFSIKNILTS